MLNKKCLRHSMNKDHRIRTYEINKISLSCFDGKIYIQNNGCDGLALGYWSFIKANCFIFQSNQDSFFLGFLVQMYQNIYS